VSELKQIRFVDYLSIVRPPLTPEAREAVARAHKTIKKWIKKQPKPPTFVHAKEHRTRNSVSRTSTPRPFRFTTRSRTDD